MPSVAVYRTDRRVPMSRMRKRIAERLKDSQVPNHTAEYKGTAKEPVLL